MSCIYYIKHKETGKMYIGQTVQPLEQRMRQIHFTSDDMFWGHIEMCPEWFWTNHPLASEHTRFTEVTGRPMYCQVFPVDDTSIY